MFVLSSFNINLMFGVNCAVVGVSFRLLWIILVASFTFLLLQLQCDATRTGGSTATAAATTVATARPAESVFPCNDRCCSITSTTMITRAVGSLNSKVCDDNDHSPGPLSKLCNDNDQSYSRLSVLKAQTFPEHGQWSIPCLANCGIMQEEHLSILFKRHVT